MEIECGIFLDICSFTSMDIYVNVYLDMVYGHREGGLFICIGKRIPATWTWSEHARLLGPGWTRMCTYARILTGLRKPASAWARK
jgi:hypothetical protein